MQSREALCTQIMCPKETGIIEKEVRESGIVFTLLITDVTLEPKFTVLHRNLRINTFIQRMCYKTHFKAHLYACYSVSSSSLALMNSSQCAIILHSNAPNT
jgi:hypothetical protein